MAQTWTTGKMAKLLGMSSEGVRNICEEFAILLSPATNPGVGKTRRINPVDAHVILRIHELTSSGMAYEDIHPLVGQEVASGQYDGHITFPERVRDEAKTISLTKYHVELSLLERQVADLTGELEEAEKARDEYASQVAERDKQISALKAIEGELRNQIEQLQQSDQSEKLSDLKAEIAVLKFQLDQLKGDS